jgi:glycosyltransferase involved in cell wall biosynthesis
VRQSGVRGRVDMYPHFANISMFVHPETLPLPRRLVFLYVGALERIKGVDVLIEAWYRVARSMPDLRLIVAGAGALGPWLAATISRRGLSNSVQIVGPLSRTGVRGLMDRSSCLIVPSRSEGLGMVILEAMARGRPVVASDTGGVPEVIEHGKNGVLVSPDDPNELADAILSLAQNPAEMHAMANAARRRALLRNPDFEFEAGIALLREWLLST